MVFYSLLTTFSEMAIECSNYFTTWFVHFLPVTITTFVASELTINLKHTFAQMYVNKWIHINFRAINHHLFEHKNPLIYIICTMLIVCVCVCMCMRHVIWCYNFPSMQIDQCRSAAHPLLSSSVPLFAYLCMLCCGFCKINWNVWFQHAKDKYFMMINYM